MPVRRRILGRAALLVLGPVVAFGVAEALLAALGAFPPVRLLVREETPAGVVWRTNPSYGTLFFDRENGPMPGPVWVPAEKRPGVRRVVLLGESAAAGFPLPEFNLARFVEFVWNHRHAGTPIEVINLTMVGVNSHLLRRFAEESLVLEPDLLVLYGGHNEMIGPLGPAAVFGRPSDSAIEAQLRLTVRNLRVVRALAGLIRDIQASIGATPRAWGGLTEFTERPLSGDDPRLPAAYASWEANLRAIVATSEKASVPLVLAVPVVNLTDWPPIAGQEALRAYREAETISSSKGYADAWSMYRRALDLDTYRFRADSRLQQMIRDVAAEAGTSRVAVADAERRLHDDNPAFVSDRAYFFEHVHLTATGRLAVAGVVVDAMARLWGVASAPPAVDETQVWAEALLYTPWDERDAWDAIFHLLQRGVFRNQPDLGERLAGMSAVVSNALQAARMEFPPDRYKELLEKALAMRPEDGMVMFTAGRTLMQMGDEPGAERLLAVGLSRTPNFSDAHLNLARIYLSQNRLREAERCIADFARWAPLSTRRFDVRGELLARQGRWVEAEKEFARAVRFHPMDVAANLGFAQALMVQGRNDQAIRAFESVLRLDPSHPFAANNLAWLLVTSDGATAGDVARASGWAEVAVREIPEERRFRGTLAVCRAASGRREEALALAREALQGQDAATAEALRQALGRFGVGFGP